MYRFHGGDIRSYEAQFHKKPLDFSVNVSPFGLPAGVRQAVIAALDDADEYPDTRCRRLRDALSAYHGVPAEWILCGNGAADLIDRLACVFSETSCTSAGEILLTAPTFTEYRFALERAGLPCDSYPLSAKTGFSVGEDFTDRITPDLTAVFLCEPNNPTGQTTDRDLLIRILERCRDQRVWLVIDECFQEFLDEPGEHTMQDFLEGYPLLILKSFTKTYAMAGLRLGYCLCADEKMLAKMEQAAQPWAVSGLAQAAGIAALQETDYKEKLRLKNRRERERLRVGLTQVGCRNVLGEANYLFFWHARTDLAQHLAKEGILIRTCTDYEGLAEHWYRVSIRTASENEQLLQALKSLKE